MKLGTQTGSLINHLSSGTNGQPAPAVGLGITLLHWTDRSAGTIVRVSPSGKTFWFQNDEAVRTDTNGMSEAQEYEYKPRPDGTLYSARQRKNGAWYSNDGVRLALGYRRAYHDYSF